jgi:hypothetical protein
MQVFRDSTRKQRSLHSKDSSLNREGNASKAHMQVHTNKGSRGKQLGRKPGPNRAELGLGRPAWADRPSPLWARFASPFCPRCLSIYCLCLLRPPHPSIHQRAAETKEKHREEADGRRESSSCLGDGLGHALATMVGPAWWSHGGVSERRLEFVKSFVPSIFGDVTISCHTLIYYELYLFICVATICL